MEAILAADIELLAEDFELLVKKVAMMADNVSIYLYKYRDVGI